MLLKHRNCLKCKVIKKNSINKCDNNRNIVYLQANEKIIFNHVVTNQDLCVEEEICVRTSFGTREYEITACTQLDSHRAEKEQNHWMVVMGVPGDDIYPVSQTSTDCSQASSAS